jgi:hypothetical protein
MDKAMTDRIEPGRAGGDSEVGDNGTAHRAEHAEGARTYVTETP